MELLFRQAITHDIPEIWKILQGAIQRRKKDGSSQWQNGYPNPEVVGADINKNSGYVLTDNDTIIGYCALFINDEPAYSAIDGAWLTNEDFIAYHRVAISGDYLGKGLAQKMLCFIEEFAMANTIRSIKVDTNFDNIGMLKILDKLGYQYCGEVIVQGGIRKAFEKVLNVQA